MSDQPPNHARQTLADALQATSCDPAIVSLFDVPTPKVIDPPTCAGVQWASDAVADPSTICAAARDGGFGFALFTDSALREPISDIVVAAIAARLPGGLSDTMVDRIGTAVHEALVNACVHGNLGIGGWGEMSADAFYRTIAETAADPARGRKTVTIVGALSGRALTVDVIDQGDGYAPSPSKEDVVSERFSGRGVALINASADSVEILDGGRRLRMRFELDGVDDVG